jgi:voltage-gated potassium channel
MSPGGRFLVAMAGIMMLTAAGTIGYMAIEHMSLLDALYMTVITISTVGYEEVKPLSAGGRIFTMVLIVTGVGSAFYLFAVVTQFVIEGQLRQVVGRVAMKHKIEQLEGHVVICGYGKMGRVVAEEVTRSGGQAVVIERDPAREPELAASGLFYVIGSALEDPVLEDAGIRRARAAVVVTASDADNVFITLSARAMNPKIHVHARGESEVGLQHLRMAGGAPSRRGLPVGCAAAGSQRHAPIGGRLPGTVISGARRRDRPGGDSRGRGQRAYRPADRRGRAERDAAADRRAQARRRSEHADSRSQNPH